MPVNEADLKKVIDNSNKIKAKTTVKRSDGVSVQAKVNYNEDTYIFAKENNRLLRKIVNHQRLHTFFSFVKILFILVPLMLAYFYLPPVLETIWGNYQSAMGTVNTLQKTTEGMEGVDLKGVDINKLDLDSIDLNKVQELFK